jgi:8-oxo-dGTP pyrophosphatase MutT (NUDIX family)
VIAREHVRRSARVLLVDRDERLLLLRIATDPSQPELGGYWLTPGGGVEAGEELAAAAARELAEETGLVVPPAALGAPVAYTTGFADTPWLRGVFRDEFFFLRAERHDVVATGLEDHERAELLEHRWWSLTELAATAERVVPLGVARLVTDLLAGRRPAEPIRLPWHH